ncbi:hypothetical protein V495_02293 [Pseudogymnoascus sp. VKM F-4514 (FW-929)]|nr:hypothetical protein V495_02293 [Pseudogymnoascus sp. VKM F-4514 (FW-929)]
MSGIPVYTQSPITAAKADGVTPQTAGPETSTKSSAPASKPATTTAVPSTTSPYAPQPGQPAVPAPTGSLGPSTGPANNYTPSPTTKTADQGPPAPQPGAVPTAPGRAKSPLPPPPKVGEKYTPPEPAPQTTSPPYPPQMGFCTNSPGTSKEPPSTTTEGWREVHTTRASTTNYKPAISPSDGVCAAGEPVPAYGDGVATVWELPHHVAGTGARASAEKELRASTWVSTESLWRRRHDGRPWHRAGDIDDNAGEESIWETAKKWATTAGGKLAETEAEIWKRVNGEK